MPTSFFDSIDDIGLSAALTGSSCKTCGELGWFPTVLPDAGTLNYPGVCAASSVFPGANGTCNTQKVTFDQALQVCSLAGARLCSLEEVYGHVSRGTGVRVLEAALASRPLLMFMACSAYWINNVSGHGQLRAVAMESLCLSLMPMVTISIWPSLSASPAIKSTPVFAAVPVS
jgi:hypothetical protein